MSKVTAVVADFWSSPVSEPVSQPVASSCKLWWWWKSRTISPAWPAHHSLTALLLLLLLYSFLCPAVRFILLLVLVHLPVMAAYFHHLTHCVTCSGDSFGAAAAAE